MSSELVACKYTPAEARRIVDEGKRGFEDLVNALTKIIHEGLWIVLKSPTGEQYQSSRQCIEEEYGRTVQWANEQLRIAEMERRVLPPPSGKGVETAVSGGTPRLNARIERQLRKLPEEKQREAYQEAAEQAELLGDKRVTEAHVQRIVERDYPPQPKAAKAEPTGRITDREGNEVPEAAREAFVDAEAWKSVGKQLDALRSDVKALAGRASAKAQNVPALLTVIGALKSATSQAGPYVSCPECEGKGCERCFGWGFLLRGAFNRGADKAGSDNQRAALKAFGEKLEYDVPGPEMGRRLDMHFLGAVARSKSGDWKPALWPYKELSWSQAQQLKAAVEANGTWDEIVGSEGF